MTEVILKKQRPKHLALNEIRLPLAGKVSILHRVSGAGLFLMLPVLLALFGASVGSPESYADFDFWHRRADSGCAEPGLPELYHRYWRECYQRWRCRNVAGVGLSVS